MAQVLKSGRFFQKIPFFARKSYSNMEQSMGLKSAYVRIGSVDSTQPTMNNLHNDFCVHTQHAFHVSESVFLLRECANSCPFGIDENQSKFDS